MAFVPFVGVDRLLAAHAASVPQPDRPAGPVVARLAVAALTGGAVPDCAAFAVAAGISSRPSDGTAGGPPGAAPATGARDGLPRATTRQTAGTPAAGVGHAVQELSGGALAAVPACGVWTPDRLRVLLDGLTGVPVLPLANVLRSWFVSPQVPAADLDAFLETGDDSGLPRSDRRSGHWVVVYGRQDGPGGTLLAVADTDPQLGENGTYRQPLPRTAAALAGRRRGTGGLVPATAAPHRAAVLAAVRAAGMRTEWWDDGSRSPARRQR